MSVECLVRDKHSSLLGPICKAWRKWIIVNIDFWDYIHNTSFLAPYKWAQQARVLKWTRVEWFARDKHSSLLSLFASYEEKEELWIWHLGLYSQYFIFFLTYELAQ